MWTQKTSRGRQGLFPQHRQLHSCQHRRRVKRGPSHRPLTPPVHRLPFYSALLLPLLHRQEESLFAFKTKYITESGRCLCNTALMHQDLLDRCLVQAVAVTQAATRMRSVRCQRPNNFRLCPLWCQACLSSKRPMTYNLKTCTLGAYSIIRRLHSSACLLLPPVLVAAALPRH